ncbi:hypothetical protein MKW98_031950, partial [Papaver atlanticum]
ARVEETVDYKESLCEETDVDVMQFLQKHSFPVQVLFLVDPINEEDLDLGDKDEEKEKQIRKEFGVTCDCIKKCLDDKVASVQISNRLSSSPCVLASGKFGWSANMDRLNIPCHIVRLSILDNLVIVNHKRMCLWMQICSSLGYRSSWELEERLVKVGVLNII